MSGSLRWALRLGRSGRGRLVVAILFGALAAGSAIGLSATAAWLITRASQHPPVLFLMVAIVSVRFFGVARGVLRYFERLASHDASFRILRDLRVEAIERLERILPGRSGAAMAQGELLARFVGDVDVLQDLWVRVVVPYAAAAFAGAATVVLVVVLAPLAGIALAASLVLSAIVAPLVSTRSARGATARLAPLRADYQTEVLDLMDGATELSVYGAIPERLERLAAVDRAMVRASSRSALSAGVGSALAVLAGGAAVWCGLWFGAGAVHARALGAVSLAVVVLAPLAVHEIVSGLAPAAHQLPALDTAATRVREVFEQPDAVIEPVVPTELPSGPFGVRIRGLRARWDADGADVLHDVNLDIAPGSTTLVVGPSGCGKSTLAAVLLRLLDRTAGSVELVGAGGAVDIADADGDSVRRVIGWCAQDAYIFDSTIEANLRLARPEATSDELAAALRRARLDGWIAGLPAGLGTMVGEHGNRLSGGQRQRLALARVILADRPVVVFDEPTEHLDEETAASLAVDLLSVTAGRTVIVVTHRPELFPANIAVIQLNRHGAAAAPGSPSALLPGARGHARESTQDTWRDAAVAPSRSR